MSLTTLFRKCLALSILLTAGLLHAFADGSKDLYFRGVKGNRAFLASRAENTANNSFAFPTRGTHYVYVKAGETLAVASSAVYMGQGDIEVTKPRGRAPLSCRAQPNNRQNNIGLIRNKGYGTREAELAGPGAGYDAWEIPVASGEEGIWRIDFYGPDSTIQSGNIGYPPEIAADANWEQTEHYCIAAWDVSVRRNSGEWISGRVFTNVLSLQINPGQLPNNHINLANANGSFYGVNYVLTNDGYVYKVDGNGSNGLAFTYFVNNKGFLDNNKQPIYKSLPSVREVVDGAVHDPREPDSEPLVTHKIMYTKPDMTMPEEADGAILGGRTWLIKPKIDAEVSNIQLTGVEGPSNFITTKGAYISFISSIAVSYRLTISSGSDQHPFAERNIIVDAQAGYNQFHWNGLDGNGNLVPVGELYPIQVEAKALGGEIHFPYFDMEINPNGILITRLHDDLIGESDAVVYWDDSLIPRGAPGESSNPSVNLTRGFPSRENGHKWGSYSNQTVPSTSENLNNLNYGSFSFGNEMSIDTWSYSLSISEQIVPEVTVRVADLEVVDITPDKTIIELEEEITYRVTIRNNGPSDANGSKFRYDLPTGFTIHSITLENTCGQAHDISHTLGSMTAEVNLENGCEMIFVITASASNVPDETYGFYPTVVGIIRPIGVTDPDATSTDLEITSPTSAEAECAGSPCNNILHNNSVFLLEPYHERGQLALVKSVVHIDTNDDGYHNVGEQLQYTFLIKNIGQVTVRNITLTDPMLSSNNINTGLTVLEPNESFQVVHSYRLVQEDLDREYVSNTAIVHGINPRGFDVSDISGVTESDDDPTTIKLYRTPYIYLRKTVTNSGTGENGQFTVGDVIHYRFEIRNDEDFALVDAVISDPLLAPSTIHIGNVAASGTTASSETYQISISDIDVGNVTNTATLVTIDQRVNRPVTVQSGYEFSNTLPTVTELAKPARAVDDRSTQYAGATVTSEILANDIPGSSSLEPGSVTVITPPANGTLEVNQNGSVSYTPNYAFSGEDSYEYRVRDASRLWSNTATVSITVQPTIVMSQEDRFGVTYNRTMQQKDVLQNDYTIGGSNIVPGSIEILRYPQYGELLSMANGVFQYRPNNNYTGYDEFTYRVRDDAGFWSEETKVTIEITGLFIPNAITPNGDGHNDTFHIIGTYAYDRVQVEIIDRFANVLYRSDSYQNDWTAENVADGTYYYIIRGFKDGKQTLYEKGAVSVIRTIMIR